MKASELRIGNLINLTKDNFTTFKIYQLDAFDIYKLSESECVDIRPIPLTEEWLIKFGFKDEGATKDLLFDYETCLERNGKNLYIAGYGAIYRKKIEYIHQLQNIYFALTEEELTYGT